ncbi:MAG: hypothetical protein ABIP14_14775, partial [Blastocatellia bacterium]
MSSNFQQLENDKAFQRLVAEVRAGRQLVNVAGLSGSAKALALATLHHATGKRLAVVSQRSRDLEDLERDLRFFYCHLGDHEECENEIFTLPASESDPYSGTSPHAEILERRALALWRLTAGIGDIVLLTCRSLMRRFAPVDEIKQAVVTLRVGEELPLEYLIEHLAAVGYVRSDPVGGVGEFSSRGGILDFYSPSANPSESLDGKGASNPVRVEFFGDEIDSIREFDPETQRSLREVKEALIVPMRDERAGADDFRQWAKVARQHWKDDRYDRALRDRTVFADEGEQFQGWEYLLPLARPLSASVFDYLHGTVLVIDEPSELEKQIRATLEELQRDYERAESIDELALAPERLFLTPEELRNRIGRAQRIDLRLLGIAAAAVQDDLNVEDITAQASMPNVGLPNSGDQKFAAFLNRDLAAPLFLFPPEPDAIEVELIS